MNGKKIRMQEIDQKNESGNNATSRLNTPGQGPQGVDKAPGEETAQDNVQFTQETQKGKKVDANPSQEEDKPVDQSL